MNGIGVLAYMEVGAYLGHYGNHTCQHTNMAVLLIESLSFIPT